MSKRFGDQSDDDLNEGTQSDIDADEVSFESPNASAPVKSALDEVFGERTVVRVRPKAASAPAKANEPPPPPPTEVTQWPPKFRDEEKKQPQPASRPIAPKPEVRAKAETPVRPPPPEKPKVAAPPPLPETAHAKPQMPKSAGPAPQSEIVAKIPTLPPLAPKRPPPQEAKAPKETLPVHTAVSHEVDVDEAVGDLTSDASFITYTGEIDLEGDAPRPKKKKKRKSSGAWLTYPQMALVAVVVVVLGFLLKSQFSGGSKASRGEVESSSVESTEVAVVSTPEEKTAPSGVDSVLTQFDESFSKTQSMAAPENAGR